MPVVRLGKLAHELVGEIFGVIVEMAESGSFSEICHRPYHPLEGSWGGCADTFFRYKSTFLWLGGHFHVLPKSNV
jgi:hypothetical protein